MSSCVNARDDALAGPVSYRRTKGRLRLTNSFVHLCIKLRHSPEMTCWASRLRGQHLVRDGMDVCPPTTDFAILLLW